MFVCIGCEKTTEYTGIFSDGLPTPDKTATFDLSDVRYGIEKINTFFIDINNNKKTDTITRERFVTGTGHAYTTYTITLDNGAQLANLKTHEGADCVLTAYKFYFDPFSIIKVSRPLGNDYTEPTKVKLEIIKRGADTKLSRQTAASASKIMAKISGSSNSSTSKNAKSSKSSTIKTNANLAPGTYWDIQLGAFSSKDNAKEFAKKVSQAGFTNIVFQTKNSSAVTIIRVAIKEVPAENVLNLQQKLSTAGFTEQTLHKRK